MSAKETIRELELDGVLDIFVAEITLLLTATKACRVDMHEPDEQDVSAKIYGNHLDNAMGSNPNQNCGEYTVELTTDGVITYHNLANLIALARIGGQLILESAKVEEIGVNSWCINEGANPMSTKTVSKPYALKVMSEYEFEQRKNKSN